MNICSCTALSMNVPLCVCVCINTWTHAHTLTYAHTCTHTHAHTCTHTCMHTHTQACFQLQVPGDPYLGGPVLGKLSSASSLRTLKKNHLSSAILVNFSRCVIESILTSWVTVWFGSCSVAEQRVRTAQRITGTPLPSIEQVQKKRRLHGAHGVLKASPGSQTALLRRSRSSRRPEGLTRLTDCSPQEVQELTAS